MRRFCLQLPVLLFLLPAVLQAQHPLTPPLLVNVPDGQSQSLPDVAASASGDFVVTWVEENVGQDHKTLRARRFSAGGASVTGEILVSDQIFLQHPAVGMREDGSFVVGFVTDSGLTVRLYGPDGGLLHESRAFAIGQYPTLATRPDGTFLLAWYRDGTIFARVFGADGVPAGPERGIGPAEIAVGPRAAAGPDRGFVVIWNRVRPIPSSHFSQLTILAQRLGPAGALRGKAITVQEEPPNISASAPDVAEDAAGNFLVAWSEYFGGGVWGILGRRYTSAGVPTSGLLTLERTGDDVHVPRLAMDPVGNFVVAWLDYGTLQVLAQRFTARGVPFRPVFQVDTPPPGVILDPDIAGAANGDFVVVWSAGEGIYARLYRKR